MEAANSMSLSFQLSKKQSYPWLFVGTISVAGLWFYYYLPETKQTPALLFSLLGSIATLFHFLYTQHNLNTDRFIKLFNEFNARFDDLNDDLNRIRLLPVDVLLIDTKDQQYLYDYFNLCAEEYLYFKSGYIDKEVWIYWCLGMGYFASNEAIRFVWTRELKQGSYYGFTLEPIDHLMKKMEAKCYEPTPHLR